MPKIYANFHNHTIESFDGYNSYSALYKYAKKSRIDIIAITDHDTIKGAFGFKKWLKNKHKTDLKVIIGEEVTCLDGTHIIGLLLNYHIASDTPLNVIAKIKEQNGLVYFPHPARKDGIMNSKQYKNAIKGGDYIEVFNGKVDHSFNEAAMLELKKQPHLKPLGGSDAHYNVDIQKCIVQLEFDESSSFEVAFKNKDFLNILILGHKHYGSRMYFSKYYQIKEKLNLPQFIREIGKVIYAFIQNYRNRNKEYKIEKVYDYHFKR